MSDAAAQLMGRMFPVNAAHLRAGIDKLRVARDGVPTRWSLLSMSEATAVLNALVRYEATVTGADSSLVGVSDG